MEFVKWFSELNDKDISIAGAKGAGLAEMYNSKFPVPPGFVVTAEAYKHFIEKNGLQKHILTILNETNLEDIKALDKSSAKIRGLIENADFPNEVKNSIMESYEVLDIDKKGFNSASGSALEILKTSYEPGFVAVRSSIIAENFEDASFAGQQETFLNVKGNESLIESIKKCWASMFSSRAIYYRHTKNLSNEKTFLAVVIQKMVDSEKSGVILSRNPSKKDNSNVIEAVWGLGEGLVSGKINPDFYAVNNNLELVDEKISDKKVAMTRTSSGKTELVKLKEERSRLSVLTGHEIKMLSQYARRLEEHYKKPQYVEFAIADNDIYIVQSRPIISKREEEDKEIAGNILVLGIPASNGVASGTVKIIRELEDISKMQRGNVLVTDMTIPEMILAINKASAVITNEGGITSHASALSREIGIPAVVSAKTAIEKLYDGQIVSVDGFSGKIIEGRGIEKKVEINPVVGTKTKIKVVVDLPDYAQKAAQSGAVGIGLVRLEPIIASAEKHPVWYLKNDKIGSYIEILYNGLRKISQPFKEIWIRTSDIRSDEYRNLEDSPNFKEQNPILGYYGIRFSLRNADLLEAEIKAIKELADEYEHKTFGIMLPRVISVDEIRETKKILSKLSMPKNVKLGIIVETPAAVQIIEELCKEGISFVSLGTNNLTQYTLAIDKNNENVQGLYDEMNPAVLNSIKRVLSICRTFGIETSICGQAGNNPEMARFLVENNIDSISTSPDMAYEISKIAAETEKFADNTDNISKESEETRKSSELKKEIKDNKNVENISEEELILKALDENKPEDEYSPSFENKEDIPSLNESIPIESELFEEKKEEKVIEIGEPSLYKESIFDKMEESVLDYEVVQKAQEFEAQKKIADEQNKAKKPQQNEALDIF